MLSSGSPSWSPTSLKRRTDLGVITRRTYCGSLRSHDNSGPPSNGLYTPVPPCGVNVQPMLRDGVTKEICPFASAANVAAVCAEAPPTERPSRSMIVKPKKADFIEPSNRVVTRCLITTAACMRDRLSLSHHSVPHPFCITPLATPPLSRYGQFPR